MSLPNQLRQIAERVRSRSTMFRDDEVIELAARELERYAAPREPLTEQQIVDCIVEAGCLGTVKLSFDSGPYEITRTTVNADKLVKAVERKHGIAGLTDRAGS